MRDSNSSVLSVILLCYIQVHNAAEYLTEDKSFIHSHFLSCILFYVSYTLQVSIHIRSTDASVVSYS